MHEFAEELRQRTFQYALRIIAACRRLPDEWIEREVGKQLLRAGMGVTGNYWSACRGRSDKKFIAKPGVAIAKLGVAVDEADESVLWLTAMTQSGVQTDVETRSLQGEGREIRVSPIR